MNRFVYENQERFRLRTVPGNEVLHAFAKWEFCETNPLLYD